MDWVSAALAESAIILEDDTPQVKENLSRRTEWASHPIWLAYATRLDQSPIMFYLPDLYDALVEITGEEFGFYQAYTISGDITLRILGVYEGNQPIGPFWYESMTLPEKGVSNRAARLLEFGKAAQGELQFYEEEWQNSCRDSEKYLSIHRACVRRVGRVLGVDMDDHDITKTRIVQVALGFMWHWPGDKSMRKESLMRLAQDAIKAGHLELEDHHPEFQGKIDSEKMFADRLAVHLQKDLPDDGNGWLLNPRFIPEQNRVQWEEFRNKNKHLNMYELVWNIISPESGNMNSPSPTNSDIIHDHSYAKQARASKKVDNNKARLSEPHLCDTA